MISKTETDQAIDPINAEEMRVRRTTLADGRYLLFYEFLPSRRLEISSELVKGEPTHSKTEPKESGV